MMVWRKFFRKEDKEYFPDNIRRGRFDKKPSENNTNEITQIKNDTTNDSNSNMPEALYERQTEIDRLNNILDTIQNAVDELKDSTHSVCSFGNELSFALDTLEDGVAVLNSDGKIKYINKILLKRLGQLYNAKTDKDVYNVLNKIINENNLYYFQDQNTNSKIIWNNTDNKYYQLRTIKNTDEFGNDFFVYLSDDITTSHKFYRAYQHLKLLIRQNESQDIIIEELKSVLKLQKDEYQKKGE